MPDALIQFFAEILGLPAERLDDDTSPKNTAQWDSLAAMHLVVGLEERFGITLGTKDIVKMTSIGAARAVLAQRNVTI